MNLFQPMLRAQPEPRPWRPANRAHPALPTLPARAVPPKPHRRLADLSEDDLPFSDGKPMADSEFQASAVIYAREALRIRYAHRADVAIEADMFLYYLPPPGTPVKSGKYPNVVPDCMVSFGATRRRGRKSYVIAREGIPRPGKVPDFVLEVASDSTWRKDYGKKRRIYESIGVSEYCIFDTRRKPAAASRILGLRLRGGRYAEIAAEPMPGGGEGVHIRALDLYAHARGKDLRLRTPAGEDLRSPDEEAQGRRTAERQRDAAMQARREEARARREEAQARRIAEQRAESAERRLAELKMQLALSRGSHE